MDSSYSIHQIMQRYEFNIADDMSFHEAIKGKGFNTDFIFSLLKAFENPTDFPEEELKKYPLPVILDYIRRTHQYYLVKKLPEIEQSIYLLIQNYSGKHPLLNILHRFYVDYKADLSGHIKAEESHLLPYIDYLLKAKDGRFYAPDFFTKTKNYSIKKFITHHHDTEEELEHVRKAILCYDPPATNQSLYRILISQLQVFEKDLSVHALIEDRILIPQALIIEKKLTGRFLKHIKLN